MIVSNIQREQATVQLNRHELVMVNNAFNEVINALSLEDFSARVGGDLDEASALLSQFNDLLDAMNEEK